MTMSDEELFEKYRAGDAGGFDELVDRYRGPLYTVIYRMVANRGDAEDIFQETFYRVVKHGGRYDSKRKFSAWIYAIATNLCRDHHRRRARSQVQPLDSGPESAGPGNPESDSFGREIGEALQAALGGLTPEQREVFLLREFGGMSFKEIAEATDSKLNTVLGRMHGAVGKLRIELSGLMEASG